MLLMKNMEAHWPAVVALAIVVAGTVSALVLVPTATWTAIPWGAIASAAAAIIAALAQAFIAPVLRSKQAEQQPATDPNPSTTTKLPEDEDTKKVRT